MLYQLILIVIVTEAVHMTLTMPTWRTVSHHEANSSSGQLVQNLKPVALLFLGV